MPYIRLYSRDMSLAEKRVVAEKLISIALNAFQLAPEERYRISVQFMPRHFSRAAADELPSEAEAVLEVSDYHLTVHTIASFVDAATPMLSQSAVVKPPSRLARWLGMEPDPAKQIAFQFTDTVSPGWDVVSNNFAFRPMRKAA
jgi:hypothetical protein